MCMVESHWLLWQTRLGSLVDVSFLTVRRVDDLGSKGAVLAGVGTPALFGGGGGAKNWGSRAATMPSLPAPEKKKRTSPAPGCAPGAGGTASTDRDRRPRRVGRARTRTPAPDGARRLRARRRPRREVHLGTERVAASRCSSWTGVHSAAIPGRDPGALRSVGETRKLDVRTRASPLAAWRRSRTRWSSGMVSDREDPSATSASESWFTELRRAGATRPWRPVLRGTSTVELETRVSTHPHPEPQTANPRPRGGRNDPVRRRSGKFAFRLTRQAPGPVVAWQGTRRRPLRASGDVIEICARGESAGGRRSRGCTRAPEWSRPMVAGAARRASDRRITRRGSRRWPNAARRSEDTTRLAGRPRRARPGFGRYGDRARRVRHCRAMRRGEPLAQRERSGDRDPKVNRARGRARTASGNIVHYANRSWGPNVLGP